MVELIAAAGALWAGYAAWKSARAQEQANQLAAESLRYQRETKRRVRRAVRQERTTPDIRIAA